MLLLAQGIQLAVRRLLQLAVARALFSELQLQNLSVAPQLIQRANLRGDLRAERIHSRGIGAALQRIDFGIGQ
ncbi:hypothetical protein D3C85_1689250 [compost metagenome]